MGCVRLPLQTDSSLRDGTDLNPIGPPRTLAAGHRGLLSKHLANKRINCGFAMSIVSQRSVPCGLLWEQTLMLPHSEATVLPSA